MNERSTLSKAASNIFGQPMFQVLSKIKEKERRGINVIHFEIGDPDFPSPPNVVEAGCRALHDGHTHYAASIGDHGLRDEICKANKWIRGFEPDIEQVMIAAGANPIIFYATACVADPGDEVIIPDPCFSTYISVMRFLGVNIVPIPLKEENQFRMDPEDIKKAITPKTKMMIINSPNNPTGSVMTKSELDEISRSARENGIYLYLDEIYRELIYTDTQMYSPSILDGCREYTIVADGFSKAYAMTGWRLGYAIAPIRLIEKMGLLLETIASCTPPFVQKAGIEALNNGHAHVNMMRSTYRKRRDLIVDGLNSIDGISCLRPDGAFYVFANIKGTGLSSKQFAEKALEECNVGLVAGTDFGDSCEGYVRLCYAQSEDKIIEGINRLKKKEWKK